jgi:hypothetical protein
MSLWQLVKNRLWGKDAAWTEQVARVATRCAAEVLRRVRPEAITMTSNQRKGYLRAQATRTVQRAVQEDFAASAQAAQQRAEIEVLERVVEVLSAYVRQESHPARLRRAA